MERGFEEAIERVRRGNEWARIALQRVVRNDLSQPQVEIARQVRREMEAI